MANTVDEFTFDENDTIKTMGRDRLNTNVDMTPTVYLHLNHQAVVTSNTLDDEDDNTTSL